MRSQGSHEVRVGCQLCGVLGELQASLSLLMFMEIVRQFTALVVQEDKDAGQNYNDDDEYSLLAVSLHNELHKTGHRHWPSNQ